tara:strand:+ start:62 stop:265 length:204 start_codon:yes stop_codon:yes gene_type:complete
MPLPALFNCHYCGEEVNSKSHLAMRLISGWVSGPTGKVVKDVAQEHYKYAHEWCMPKKAEDATPPMF